MGYEQVGKLIDRWMNDPSFRKAVRDNPEAAVKGVGINLSQEERAALLRIDWNQSDEELKARISKGM